MVAPPVPVLPSARPAAPGRSAAPVARLRAAWDANPPLALVGVATLALAVPFAAGVVLDPTVVAGAPAWLKPAKFALSIAVYSLTLLWFLSFVRGRRRLVAAVGWGTAAAFALEIAIIAGQTARGTTSHFNDATRLDAALFGAMGAAIVVVWLLGLAAAVVLLRQAVAPPALAWALRLGMAGALVGMLAAVPMVAVVGGHAVGVADGGPGLPVVGWSTEGGDLRVGHFVGLHAMQALPLVALLLGRFAPAWLSEGRRAALVGVVGAGWIGLTLVLTWQALRGQPPLAPDAATLAALAGLALGVVVAAAAVVLTARRRHGRA